MVEKIKILIAIMFDYLQILNYLLKKNKINNSIRIINYHRTPVEEMETFQKQIKYFKKNYQNIDYKIFEKFKNNEIVLDKPGLIITFDDGLKNNYDNALKILEDNGFTGYFFVSTALLDTEDFMSKEDVVDIVSRGHVIGCHTNTHHRMDENDTFEVLNYEIVEAKTTLEDIIKSSVDIFCWCGGEENTYTRKAYDIIKKKYKYSFMTNNEIVLPKTDNYLLQRTNIEARWPISLCKFQLSGIMDFLYKNKRERVLEKLK